MKERVHLFRKPPCIYPLSMRSIREACGLLPDNDTLLAHLNSLLFRTHHIKHILPSQKVVRLPCYKLARWLRRRAPRKPPHLLLNPLSLLRNEVRNPPLRYTRRCTHKKLCRSGHHKRDRLSPTSRYRVWIAIGTCFKYVHILKSPRPHPLSRTRSTMLPHRDQETRTYPQVSGICGSVRRGSCTHRTSGHQRVRHRW